MANEQDIFAPTPDAQVQQPQDTFRQQASPADFGAPIAQGVEQLGAGVTAAGNFWGGVQTDASLNGAYKQGQQLVANFQKLNGADAVKNLDATKAQLEQAFQQAGAQLPSAAQRVQFDSASRAYIDRTLAPQLDHHANDQGRSYAINTATDAFNEAGGRAAIHANNPEEVLHARADAEDAYTKMLQAKFGLTLTDEQKAQATAAANKQVYTAQVQALAVKSPALAQKVLEQHQSDLGENYAPLAERLSARADQDIGTQAAQTAIARAGQGLLNQGQPSGAQPIPNTETTKAAPTQIASTITDAAKRAGVDPAYMLSNAHAESSFNPEAKAPTSSATGLFQFTDGTWLQLLKQYGAKYGLEGVTAEIRPDQNGNYTVADQAERQRILDLRKDPATASQMAAEFTAANKSALQQATGRNPTSTDLYAAHFLGAPGAVRLLSAVQSDPNQPAAAVLPAAAQANKQIFYGADNQPISVGQVYQTMAAKIGGSGAATAALSNIGPPGFPSTAMKASAFDQLYSMNLTPRQFQEATRVINEQATAASVASMQNDAARKQASDAAANTYVTDFLNGRTDGLVQRIANDPNLAAETKLHLGQTVEASMVKSDGKDSATYGPQFWNAYQRIHLPDGDLMKITSPQQLYEWGPKGDLTMSGIDKLTAELQSKKTPEGEAEAAMRLTFMKNAHAQISGKNELMGFADPKGEEQFLKFQAAFLPAYDKAKAEGAPAYDLLNPSSPKYLGKIIPTFVRPQSVQQADLMAANPILQGPGTAPDADTQAPKPDLSSKEGIAAAFNAGTLSKAQAIGLLRNMGGYLPGEQAPAGNGVPLAH